MTERIRGRHLQRLRREMLTANPLCVQCQKQGRIKQAEELDHIIPLHKGGSNNRSNLMPLCKSCHAAKTAEDMGHKQHERIEFNRDGKVVW